MVAYLALGIALLLSLLLIARWVVAADPRVLVKGVRYGGGAAAAFLALYLVISGRWPYALSAVVTALPFIMRWRLIRDRFRSSGGPSAGRRSEVTTAMLRMTLDHDTGAMSGIVIKGRRASVPLERLSLEELMDLLAECRVEDPQSVPLLEGYLERRFGAAWQESGDTRQGASAERPPPRSSGAMSRQEALDILGLAEGASSDQIKEAYHRLIMKLHPDTGGSVYLATKLNQAKDILLGS